MHFDFTPLVIFFQSAEGYLPAVIGLGGSLLVALLTTIGQKKTASFYYGKLTEKVDGHSADIKKLEVKTDNHETRISHLEGAKHGKAWGAGASH
jgi:hypothetical protein